MVLVLLVTALTSIMPPKYEFKVTVVFAGYTNDASGTRMAMFNVTNNSDFLVIRYGVLYREAPNQPAYLWKTFSEPGAFLAPRGTDIDPLAPCAPWGRAGVRGQQVIQITPRAHAQTHRNPSHRHRLPRSQACRKLQLLLVPLGPSLEIRRRPPPFFDPFFSVRFSEVEILAHRALAGNGGNSRTAPRLRSSARSDCAGMALTATPASSASFTAIPAASPSAMKTGPMRMVW